MSFTGYGANIFGRIGLRGAADGLRKAREISREAKVAKEDAKKAAEEIKITMYDQLALSLNLLSTIQLSRFIAIDFVRIASGKGGFGDILSIATSTVIVLYRMKQLYETIIGLQKVSAALAALGPMGPAMIVGTVFMTGMLGSIFEAAEAAKSRVDQDRRKVALKWGSLVG